MADRPLSRESPHATDQAPELIVSSLLRAGVLPVAGAQSVEKPADRSMLVATCFDNTSQAIA